MRHFPLRLLTLASGLGLLLTAHATSLRAQDNSAQVSARPENLIQPETERAIKAGLNYLQSQQNADGSFGTGGYSRNVAICSLAAMAFMTQGSTPGRGPYGAEVNRCLSYVVNSTREDGFIVAPEAVSHGPMYGHGFATLFLAEAYGMSPDPGLRTRLSRAVQLIIGTQNDEGGWRYEPKRSEADISVTVCQVMALRAARNAGIYVPNETIEACTDYVRRCQNPDGGFMYRLTEPGVSAFPRSAAAVVALYSAGIYNDEVIDDALQYLVQSASQDNVAAESHFFYGHYYAVQAMWQAGGDYWRGYYPTIHKSLLARQTAGGAWPDRISSEYGTAMACIILQMPNNYLPIFQR